MTLDFRTDYYHLEDETDDKTIFQTAQNYTREFIDLNGPPIRNLHTQNLHCKPNTNQHLVNQQEIIQDDTEYILIFSMSFIASILAACMGIALLLLILIIASLI